MQECFKIDLTDDEREMLYKLQSMRWSSFQGKSLSKIDGEYQKIVIDDLQHMMERLEPFGDRSIEFSRQQLHINVTLLDMLIFSMDTFRQVEKSEKNIAENMDIVATAQKLRQKIVNVLMPDAWFGTSSDIQRATYDCYEMINGWDK
jgi:hypothetical protein|nr:MAG: hypothetical protein [Bacteriophage sp.]UVX33957.1 MAG: hypothetical protein [Bacteriophage sp.]UVX37177.1 MAG: hypothetical protein [Bacteriophage sp.]UWI26712.1 MAG: hypothetical protein [Bacteriophage sp.]